MEKGLRQSIERIQALVDAEGRNLQPDLELLIRASTTPEAVMGAAIKMAEALDIVTRWLEQEVFDDDAKDHLDTTQEERAENISEVINRSLAAWEKCEVGS